MGRRESSSAVGATPQRRRRPSPKSARNIRLVFHQEPAPSTCGSEHDARRFGHPIVAPHRRSGEPGSVENKIKFFAEEARYPNQIWEVTFLSQFETRCVQERPAQNLVEGCTARMIEELFSFLRSKYRRFDNLDMARQGELPLQQPRGHQVR